MDALRISEGAREVTAALGVKACQDDPVACASEGGLGNVENLIQQKARLYVRQARMMTDRTVQNLEIRLARPRQDSRPQNRRLDVRRVFRPGRAPTASIETAAQAARSGITIYSIDGRGLINGLGTNTDAVAASGPLGGV